MFTSRKMRSYFLLKAGKSCHFSYSYFLVMQLEDTLWSGLTDAYAGIPMAITAENLAEQYGVTRSDCDEYALQSQQRWQNGTLLSSLFMTWKVQASMFHLRFLDINDITMS